ncbi:trypsin-like peptidase domain-containing protein [candidate division WWE3 bacterium]|nr:trypsin-like peptidase domain-containing protein [candidate division WWE3 bacterium]
MGNIINKIFIYVLIPSLLCFLLLGFFALGALSDRLFYIKPLDYIYKRMESNDTKLLNRINGTNEDIADISQLASKSVITVAIRTIQRTNTNPSFLNDFFGLNFFSQDQNSQKELQELQEIKQDIGSGFVVDGGFVVTNKHVVAEASAKFKIIDSEDKEYDVIEIYRDPANDFAILKVKDFSLPGIQLGDSDKLRVGQRVIAIGTALGEFRHTVTTGVISGLARGITADSGFGVSEDLENVIQTDAAINPGNSGGPLLDMNGDVIGINVAVSRGAENIGFALPVNILKNSLENFNSTGQFERPYIGIKYQTISKKAALKNEVPSGAYVSEVLKDSPASKAGIKVGDIITDFAGEAVGEKNLATLVNKRKVGENIEIKVYRWDEEKNLEFSLKLERLPSL